MQRVGKVVSRPKSSITYTLLQRIYVFQPRNHQYRRWESFSTQALASLSLVIFEVFVFDEVRALVFTTRLACGRELSSLIYYSRCKASQVERSLCKLRGSLLRSLRGAAFLAGVEADQWIERNLGVITYDDRANPFRFSPTYLHRVEL